MMMSTTLSDQPIASLRDDVIPHYDDVIPEFYATNMPHIMACKTSDKWTSREAEDKHRRADNKGRQRQG